LFTAEGFLRYVRVMRLALKLLSSLAVLTVLVIGLAAFAEQRRRDELLVMDIETEARLAVALRAVVEKVCELAGPGSAKAIIDALDVSTPQRKIRWLAPGDVPKVAGRDLGAEVAAHMATGDPVWAYFPNQAGESVRYVYIPVAHAGEALGVIEASQSLAPHAAYVRRAQIQTAAVGLVVLLLSGALAVVLGRWMIGQPVAALAANVRALGNGEFVRPTVGARRDEIGELASELSNLSDRLAARERLRHDDRLRTIGQLAAGVAHELGTPLSVVAVRAQLIASDEAVGMETAANATAILDQTERMTRLVRQLLDFSRRGTGRAEDVDLREAGLRTMGLLEPLARARGVTLVAAADVAAVVHVDPTQLEQVLTNLVLNGIQAMAPGGRLEIRTGRGVVTPPASGGPAAVRCWIRVTDDGPGIAPDDLAHVFEPFFTSKPVGEGTGLGLAVAQTIVDEHGGWIGVETAPGRGAAFTVYLPPAVDAAHDRLAS
jgi:two-component system NtrC family sensor kinase